MLLYDKCRINQTALNHFLSPLFRLHMLSKPPCDLQKLGEFAFSTCKLSSKFFSSWTIPVILQANKIEYERKWTCHLIATAKTDLSSKINLKKIIFNNGPKTNGIGLTHLKISSQSLENRPFYFLNDVQQLKDNQAPLQGPLCNINYNPLRFRRAIF